MVTTKPEPHAARRRAMLKEHPEIRSLFGHDVRTAWITYAVVLGQLGMAYAMERLASWSLIVATAWLVGAFAAKWSGVAIHESSHNLVYRTRTQNLVFSIVANIPVLVPSAIPFRRRHRDHHAHMGIRGIDNDLPTRFEERVVGTCALAKLVWLSLYVFFGTLARGFLNRPTRWEIANVVVQVACDVAIVCFIGWTGTAYLALSIFFGFGLHPVAGHFIHEHYLWSDEQETYSYYGPLNKVTRNLGYHVEHHDFPGIPSARLPELHALARPHYASLVSHDSWTGVMWRFVKTPSLGHHSRFTREKRR